MLAIGRALMGRPKLLLLDEPSMGLAPLMVEKVFEVIRAVAAEGMTILLVEQNARLRWNSARAAMSWKAASITLADNSAALLAATRLAWPAAAALIGVSSGTIRILARKAVATASIDVGRAPRK
jgi:ABC-type branched-subunit amino acid transport system ATPase component